jgi:N-acetylglucosamine kinase-like BadF-type ATPase
MIGIGFDSGGTRTSYAIDAGDGPEKQIGSEAPVSIADARGELTSRAAIDWIVKVILDQDDDEIVVWIGAAGFSTSTAPAIERNFAGPLEELTEHLETSGRYCEIYIANDAVSILKAPPLLGRGVAAIVGTGSVVLGAHPSCAQGVVKRGGLEWLVSDEGAGVWMTLQSVRLLVRDIQTRGSQDYHSVLLDRLADFLDISYEDTQHVPASHRAMAKADLIARKISISRADAKRFFAGFAYPHIFDLAVLEAGRPYDPIAAEVLQQSVKTIAEAVRSVSDTLAAHTADEPNRREKLPLVVGGNIAANPYYDQLLRAEISSNCRFIDSVTAIGDAAGTYARLSMHYMRADPRSRATIAHAFDPLHAVLRLL